MFPVCNLLTRAESPAGCLWQAGFAPVFLCRTLVNIRLKSLLEISERILTQSKNSKNKIYSIHSPEVECISKGKSHKRYEFGCKVSLVTTSKSNWVVGVQALHDNPYDGHTLKDAINQMEKIVGLRPKEVYVLNHS
ncbi:hypothetical protein [Leptospira noguchii]|uniref:hypothetical protein n=1 Tax=Leptospira noguchii TaxID=28182 RepID=UPI003D766C64